jgi:hypothetical protein
MATTFILGAGFSIPAKFPSGHSLNEKFFKNLENNILKFSNGLWTWNEYDHSTAQNGRLNLDHLNISLLLSELIEYFQKLTFLPFDYEEFYDWIHREYDDALIKQCCYEVNKRLESRKSPDYSGHLFQNPGLNEYRKIQDCYSYLIADLLGRGYKRKENANQYSQFIDSITKDAETNIFTLNHDSLLEDLMTKDKLRYSDGFSTINSRIINSENEKMPVFTNEYQNGIKLHKLHGSVDYYLFSAMKPSNNGIYYYTGDYWFFKPEKYWDIQTCKLIDQDYREVLQAVNPDIKPQFLTGKSKLGIINDHLIYKHLYSNLQNSLLTTNKLIIIGYSYRDTHINKLIKECLDINSCEIVNVNPHVSFPFRRNFSQDGITQLGLMSEL